MDKRKFLSFFKSKHIMIIGVFFLLTGIIFAQSERKIDSNNNTGKQTNGQADSLKQEKKTLVYLEQSDVILFDQKRLPDVQIIKGNVRFRHDNALMFCDSAYFYNKQSSFDAFGNVRIVEGDSIFIYGDKLFYDGNSRLARMRNNVRMESKNAVLTTDSMNYDRARDLAYYYTGGKLQDDQNTLTSIWGQYSPNTKQALFKNDVHLANESFTMDADTLKYNTDTHIADIVGPTHIIYQDETDIYSTRGWYNTDTEKSMLLDRSLIVHGDGKTLTGDTLYYDKMAQLTEGFSNIEMTDSTQKATMCGDYVFYDEVKEFGLATDSALLVDWSTTDTLYLHADTLSMSKDSIYDVVRAFYNVRFFRSDLQGACDSLVYLSKDSIATMYGQPVVWSGQNQLSGETIKGYIKNETLDHIHVPREALVVQLVDSVNYNQVGGKELMAYMNDGKLSRVQMSGNAETIYFLIDDKDSTLLGINKTQSSFVNMYLKDQKLDRIVLTDVGSSGIVYPVNELSGDDLFLNNFFWIEEQQPKQKSDVFLIFPKNRHKSNIVHVRSAASAAEPQSAATSASSQAASNSK